MKLYVFLWYLLVNKLISINAKRKYDFQNTGREGEIISTNYFVSPNWTISHKFGQITAVSIDEHGNIIIFHRGSHVWNSDSFDSNDYYLLPKEAIPEDTIVTINPSNLSIISSWGSKMFFLPHGLTLYKGDFWLTDVAMHQVFKFTNGKKVLELGEVFVPGHDQYHFCKPTSVAVDNNEIYVADGYCNSRIIRFNNQGKFLNQWGKKDIPGKDPLPYSFSIPHKIILLENQNIACVADREHARIQCFSTPLGVLKYSIKLNDFTPNIYSISSKCGMLFAINGLYASAIQGFIFDEDTRELISTFKPDKGQFTMPHDLAVSDNCDSIFVVEIGPNNIWKFDREGLRSSFKEKIQTSQTSHSQAPAFLSKISESFVSKISPFSNNVFISFSFAWKLSVLLGLFILLFICWRLRFFRKKGIRTNIGRLLKDPEKSGFNRLAIDSEESESEVEEFNVCELKKI